MENQDLRQQQGQHQDLKAVRESILSGLKVGKQSSEYKRTKAVIDRFMALVTVAMIGLNESDPARTQVCTAYHLQERRFVGGGVNGFKLHLSAAFFVFLKVTT